MPKYLALARWSLHFIVPNACFTLSLRPANGGVEFLQHRVQRFAFDCLVLDQAAMPLFLTAGWLCWRCLYQPTRPLRGDTVGLCHGINHFA